MSKNNYIIRLERKEDYRTVENLVRESFWNVYRPGCQEHYILKQLRNDPAFVHDLDFVMERDGKLIGQNIFVRAIISAGSCVQVLCSPISMKTRTAKDVCTNCISRHSLQHER